MITFPQPTITVVTLFADKDFFFSIEKVFLLKCKIKTVRAHSNPEKGLNFLYCCSELLQQVGKNGPNYVRRHKRQRSEKEKRKIGANQH